MLTVAVGTVFFLHGAGKKRFVQRADFVPGVTAHAERINLRHGVHNIRWRDVIFVAAVGVGGTVALLTVDVGLCVHKTASSSSS